MKSVNTDLAYDHIRKKILNGEYPPGQPLMTEDLAAEIGVSRTPVRDAFRKLEADGLVTIRPHAGASVKMMDMNEYRDTCGMRLALESYAAGLAAENRSAVDLREIGYALEAMRHHTAQIAAEKQEPRQLFNAIVREDIRFHVAIIAAAKNEVMKKEILRLHLLNRLVAGMSPADTDFIQNKNDWQRHQSDVLKGHEEIYEAIRNGDSAGAKNAMEHHLRASIDSHMRRLRTEPSLAARELSEDELNYAT